MPPIQYADDPIVKLEKLEKLICSIDMLNVYDTMASLPVPGKEGRLYFTTDDNYIHVWNPELELGPNYVTIGLASIPGSVIISAGTGISVVGTNPYVIGLDASVSSNSISETVIQPADTYDIAGVTRAINVRSERVDISAIGAGPPQFTVQLTGTLTTQAEVPLVLDYEVTLYRQVAVGGTNTLISWESTKLAASVVDGFTMENDILVYTATSGFPLDYDYALITYRYITDVPTA